MTQLEDMLLYNRICVDEVPLLMSPVMQAMGWRNVHTWVRPHVYEHSKTAASHAPNDVVGKVPMWFIVFVLDFGVLWIRAKGRHTYPSSGAFETQCVLYDPGHLLSLSHSTRPEVRLYCFWYRFCTCCGKRRCRLRDGTATSSSLAFSFFLWYAVLVLYLGFVLRWMLAVYRHIPHLRDAFGNTVRWLWVLASVSAFNKVGSLFW